VRVSGGAWRHVECSPCQICLTNLFINEQEKTLSKHEPLTKAIQIETEIKVKIIDIEAALVKRDGDYRCPHCGQSVTPFKQGTTGATAHFEHARAKCCPK